MSRAVLFGLLAALSLGEGRHLFAQDATPRAGFPVTLTGHGRVVFSSPVAADLDGDGSKEIVVATSGVWNGSAYTSLPRLWVVRANGTADPSGAVRWFTDLTSEPYATPAIGDLTGDGVPEIVVAYGGYSDEPTPGGVKAFQKTGANTWSQLWSFQLSIPGTSTHVLSSPALGDIDGDGVLDVVFGALDLKVHALKGTNGQAISGFPVLVYDSVRGSPALADLDGDGEIEIIVGADCNPQGPPINTKAGGALWVLRTDGTIYPGFPRFVTPPAGQTPVGIGTAPVVGDIDGDGCPEIVTGTDHSSSPAQKLIYAWHNDGRTVAGWPVPLSGHASGDPALANLDADAALEVVATDDTGRVYGIDGDGSKLFTTLPKSYQGTSAVAASGPIAAQVGSEAPAVLLGSVDWQVTILSKAGVQLSDDGPPPDGKPRYLTGSPVRYPLVADLTGSGTITLVAASKILFGSDSDAGVYAWDLGSAGALPWPAFQQDERHSGWAPPKTTPPSCVPVPPPSTFHPLTPCRFVDTRWDAVLTYGGPAFAAGETRVITVTDNPSMPQACGVPADAKAVALNVTVALSSSAGVIRIFPGGERTPVASTLSFAAGRTRANNAIVRLSPDERGNISVLADQPSGEVHVILDVSGYFK